MENEQAVDEGIIKTLTEKGYSVRKATEEKEIIDREIKNSHAKIYNTFDAETESLTGLKKEPSEKTSDFVKRAISEKTKSIAQLQERVKEYETKGIQSNDVALEYKKQNEILQEEKKKLEAQYQKEIQDLKGHVFSTKKDAIINGAISTLRPTLKADLTEQIKEDIIYAKVKKFNEDYTAKEFEGLIIFVDKDGEVVRKDGKPMNANEILAKMFEPYLEKGRKLGGNGGKNEKSDAVDWTALAIEKGFKRMDEVTAYLDEHFAKIGVPRTSKEYNEAWNKFHAVVYKR